MSAHAEDSIHDEASLLLPWYVNGTLDDARKALIEDHVRSCLMCRRALPAEYRILDVFRNASPLDQSMQAGFERLHSRIAARETSRTRKEMTGSASIAWRSVGTMLRQFTGGTLRPALVAASLAALVVGLALTHLFGEQPVRNSESGYGDTSTASEGYHTLSRAGLGTANEDDVHVIFTRYTSAQSIERLLNAIPARIVTGPDNTGVYTVRLLEVSGESERQAAIAKLRNQPKVIFAEAAQPLAVSTEGRAPSQ